MLGIGASLYYAVCCFLIPQNVQALLLAVHALKLILLLLLVIPRVKSDYVELSKD